MIRVLTALSFLFLVGCSNPCEQLADKVCERAGDGLSECQGVASSAGDGAADEAKACARMMAVVASCRTLREKAPAADGEDLHACRADLELIRALERAQN